MSAQAASRNTEHLPGGVVGPDRGGAYLAASTTIYQGSLVALDSAGRLVPASASPGLKVVGRARATYTATSADTVIGEWEYGIFGWANSSSGDAITAAHVGRLCFAVFDNQVALTPDTDCSRPVAGIVVGVDSTRYGVAVLTQAGDLWKQHGLGVIPTVTSGAIPVGARAVRLSVTGTVAYTLADGLWVGQRIRAVVSVAASTPAGTVTPATGVSGVSTVSGLGVVGENAEWEWLGSAGWLTIGGGGTGVTVA